MSETLVSARLPQELIAQADTLAKALKRSRTWVIEEALRAYVDTEAEFLAAVQQGREDIAAGRYVELDDLDAELDAIIVSKKPN